jgi:hypothetical protein
MNGNAPPPWAERLLRLQLAPHDRDPVSGDLLELYLDRVDAGGVARADLWYVLEVLRVTWLETGPWIVLFALATIARTALDWLVPTTDFAVRSAWTTAVSVGVLFTAGLAATWRLRSVGSAVAAGLVTSLGGGLLHAVAAATLLALRHDPATLDAIRASGGLSEALTLPLLTAVPAAFVAALGGTLSWLTRGTTPRVGR